MLGKYALQMEEKLKGRKPSHTVTVLAAFQV